MIYVYPLLSYLILIVGILICVAFIVLLERKVLGYIQLRKGPNKVGVIGVLQSFSDAIKLFTKEQVVPSYSNMIPFYISPLLTFSIILFLWVVIPFDSYLLNLEMGGLLFFCCTSLSVYGLMVSGWASNSNYAMLGAMRGVAQTISYEVSLAFFFISLMCLVGSLNFEVFKMNQEYIIILFIMVPLFFMWLASSLAETNRTPFDFAEGESELVSGFNVEYGSGGFALLFLAEYASIIFMSYLLVVLFLGGLKNFIYFNILGIIFCFVFIWMRGTLPRLRYDKLMLLAWKSFLPNSLCFFLFFLSLEIFFK
uniref:NADH-ubiquinone oxidoreductase chain 1 n=1 Tax=Friesea antarctica TaxID=2720488 RepID=B2BSF0_9HEXA|nr:NADH dehydrogenase subunit 1 [Friesea antarctica]ABS57603.1 NADH dehydrogenase subunit 1 [Friesea antarctica]